MRVVLSVFRTEFLWCMQSHEPYIFTHHWRVVKLWWWWLCYRCIYCTACRRAELDYYIVLYRSAYQGVEQGLPHCFTHTVSACHRAELGFRLPKSRAGCRLPRAELGSACHGQSWVSIPSHTRLRAMRWLSVDIPWFICYYILCDLPDIVPTSTREAHRDFIHACLDLLIFGLSSKTGYVVPPEYVWMMTLDMDLEVPCSGLYLTHLDDLWYFWRPFILRDTDLFYYLPFWWLTT
jgi:hypothetical protein